MSEKQNQKYGVIMVGKIDGETVMVAPFTEGRFVEDIKLFSVAKGDPKTGIRKDDANIEFNEETGIDIALLEKSPNSKERLGEDGKDIFGGAKIIKRIEIEGQDYPAATGNIATLNLDVVIVENIAALAPHLKGRECDFVPASKQAEQLGLPSFDDVLNKIKEEIPSFPVDINNRDQFNEFIKDRENRKLVQPILDAIRNDLEEKGLVSGEKGVKFDNKINPASYFQEGAVIVTVDEYVNNVKRLGVNNEKYSSSMLGNGEIEGQLNAVQNAIERAEQYLKMKSTNLEPKHEIGR